MQGFDRPVGDLKIVQFEHCGERYKTTWYSLNYSVPRYAAITFGSF
jgi:hypothetical protein